MATDDSAWGQAFPLSGSSSQPVAQVSPVAAQQPGKIPENVQTDLSPDALKGLFAKATEMANEGGPGANDAAAQKWLAEQMQAPTAKVQNNADALWGQSFPLPKAAPASPSPAGDVLQTGAYTGDDSTFVKILSSIGDVTARQALGTVVNPIKNAAVASQAAITQRKNDKTIQPGRELTPEEFAAGQKIGEVPTGVFGSVVNALGHVSLDPSSVSPLQAIRDSIRGVNRLGPTSQDDTGSPDSVREPTGPGGLKPTTEALLQDSVPASILKRSVQGPQQERRRLQAIHQYLWADNYLKSGATDPAMIKVATDAKASLEAGKGPSGPLEYLKSMKDSINADPAAALGSLFNSLQGDPELLLIGGGGSSVKALSSLGKAAGLNDKAIGVLKGIESTGSAAATGGAINAGIDIAHQGASETGSVKPGEVSGAAALGAGLGAAIHGTGAVIKAVKGAGREGVDPVTGEKFDPNNGPGTGDGEWTKVNPDGTPVEPVAGKAASEPLKLEGPRAQLEGPAPDVVDPTAPDTTVGQTPKGSQAGSISPEMLARLGVTGAATAAGAYLGGPDHRVAGGIAGALAGLLVPGGGDIQARGFGKFQRGAMGGERAVGANTDTLQTAKAMDDFSKDSVMTPDAVKKQIFDKTGWFKNAAGEWKFEINDSDAKVIPAGINAAKMHGGEISLQGIYSNPKLFEAYPALKDISVKIKPLRKGLIGGWDGKTLTLSSDPAVYVNKKMTPAGITGVIGHEAQHIVQDLEGHARGGNAEEFLNDTFPETAQRQTDINKGSVEMEASLKRALPNDSDFISNTFNNLRDRLQTADTVGPHKALKGLITPVRKISTEIRGGDHALSKQLDEFINKVDDAEFYQRAKAHQKYSSLVGEEESRNVEKRLRMTPEERRAIPPWETEDNLPSHQVVRHNSRSMAMSEDAPTMLEYLHEAGVIDSEGKPTGLVLPRDKLPNEEQVIGKAKEGDQNAMAELYKQYLPRLRNSLRGLAKTLGPRLGVDEQDLAQEAFIRAFSNLDKFDGSKNFYTWLHQVAQNKGLDTIRQMDRRIRTQSMFASGDGTPEGVPDIGKGAIKPGVEEKMADFEDPEFNAEADQAAAVFQYAFENLPKKLQAVLHAIEIEGLSGNAAAIKLNIDPKQIPVFAARARDAMKASLLNGQGAKLNKAFNKAGKEGGFVTHDMLKMLAAMGAGGIIGTYLASKGNKLSGAALGVLTAALLLTRGKAGTTAIERVVQGIDYHTGLVSTRILNKAPMVYGRLNKMYQTIPRQVQGHDATVEPFLKKMSKLPAKERDQLERTLLTGKKDSIDAALNKLGDPELSKSWDTTKRVLTRLGDELENLGVITRSDKIDYFPRRIKDIKKFLNAMEGEHKTYLEDAIKAAQKTSQTTRGRPLSSAEEAIIINNYMRSEKYTSSQPDFAKSRSVGEITPSLKKFYESPAASLHSYIRDAVTTLEEAKFFGKSLQMATKGKLKFTDADASVGELIHAGLADGSIKAKDVDDVGGMLRSLFNGGNRSPGELVQLTKNATYLALLGTPEAGISQASDLMLTMHAQGVLPTVTGLVRSLTGQNLLPYKDTGLINHIAEEYAQTSKGSYLVNLAFKTGLTPIDFLGKQVAMNAAYSRLSSKAKTPRGQVWLANKYGKIFGMSAVDDLIKDAAQGKTTPLINEIIFMELSRTQPISKMEVPQAYLDHPDGRLLYTLKTFTLKAADMVRRDAYNNIKNGHIVKGVAALMSITLMFALGRMGQQDIKDWIFGREHNPENDNFMDAALNNVNLDHYFTDTFFGVTKEQAAYRRAHGEPSAAAKTAHPYLALGRIIAPPIDWIDDIFKGGDKAASHIPLIGPLFKTRLQKAKAAKANDPMARIRKQMRDARAQ